MKYFATIQYRSDSLANVSCDHVGVDIRIKGKKGGVGVSKGDELSV